MGFIQFPRWYWFAITFFAFGMLQYHSAAFYSWVDGLGDGSSALLILLLCILPIIAKTAFSPFRAPWGRERHFIVSVSDSTTDSERLNGKRSLAFQLSGLLLSWDWMQLFNELRDDKCPIYKFSGYGDDKIIRSAPFDPGKMPIERVIDSAKALVDKTNAGIDEYTACRKRKDRAWHGELEARDRARTNELERAARAAGIRRR